MSPTAWTDNFRHSRVGRRDENRSSPLSFRIAWRRALASFVRLHARSDASPIIVRKGRTLPAYDSPPSILDDSTMASSSSSCMACFCMR